MAKTKIFDFEQYNNVTDRDFKRNNECNFSYSEIFNKSNTTICVIFWQTENKYFIHELFFNILIYK